MDFDGVAAPLSNNNIGQNGGIYEIKQESEEYENKYIYASNKCKELTTVVRTIFGRVSSLIQTQSNNESFLQLLTNELKTSQQSIEQVIASDESLYSPTQLQNELNQLKNEKIYGLQKLNAINEELKSLKKQKEIWESEKIKGKQLIEQLQNQTNNNNVNNNVNITNNNANIDNSDEINGLKQEIVRLTQENNKLKGITTETQALANENVVINNINNDNNEKGVKFSLDEKRASTNAETFETLNMLQNKSSLGKKHLVRLDTTTNWKDDDLAALKQEIQGAMQDITKKKLYEQTEKQFGWNDEDKENDDNNNNNNNDIIKEQKDDIDTEKRPSGGLLRSNEEEMDQQTLEKLQNELNEQFSQIKMAEKKKKLGEMFKQKDDLDELEEMQKGMDLSTKMGMNLSIDPNDPNNISENDTNNDSVPNIDEDDPEAMKEQMMALKKKILMAKFKAADDALYGPEDVGDRTLIDANDREEIERMIIAERKRKIFNSTEPRDERINVKEQHFNEFEYVLKSIGIRNEHVKKALWQSLRESIKTIEEEPELNDPKNETFNLNVGGHRVFKSIDFRTEKGMDDLRDQIEDKNMGIAIERTEDISKQLNLEENDEFIKYKNIVETKINELSDELDQVKSDCDILNKNAARFNQEQSEKETEILQLNQKVNQLKQDNIITEKNYKNELDKVISSKVKLIEACSKEINELRSLLRRYNILVNTNV